MIDRFLQTGTKRPFSEGFNVLGIAEARVSFYADRNAVEVQQDGTI